MQPWPVKLSPTRPQEVIDFEELLSELTTVARMLRPHLGSRLVSNLLTYEVRRRTLSCKERCGRRPFPYSQIARVAMRAAKW